MFIERVIFSILRSNITNTNRGVLLQSCNGLCSTYTKSKEFVPADSHNYQLAKPVFEIQYNIIRKDFDLVPNLGIFD